MKLFFALLLFFAFSSALHARVLTVSNRPGAAAQYQTVNAAIAAAAVGDTIYIHGSETDYGSFTIDKKLTFIGTGHNPKPGQTQALVAFLQQVTIGVQNAGASGSAIIGLKIQNVQTSTYGQSDIVVRRCNIGSMSANGTTNGICKNWFVDNNIISVLQIGGRVTDAVNFIIKNNIVNGYISSANTCLISNNVFIGGGNSQSFYTTHNSIIQNNIFHSTNPEGAINSTFNNNITFGGTATALPYGTNSGNANKPGVDPLFTKYPGGGFTYDHDFHLRIGSPGRNAGTDGTDIGLYGGLGYSETGEPPIPVVRSFTIQNGVVAPGGKLKIQIKAEARN